MCATSNVYHLRHQAVHVCRAAAHVMICGFGDALVPVDQQRELVTTSQIWSTKRQIDFNLFLRRVGNK